MASLELKIQPLSIPDHILVEVPGETELLEVSIEELDEATLAELLEEFSANLLAKVSK